MKISIILESPLLEAFSLTGVDYAFEPENVDIQKLEESGMIIVNRNKENYYSLKYPSKIVVGI